MNEYIEGFIDGMKFTQKVLKADVKNPQQYIEECIKDYQPSESKNRKERYEVFKNSSAVIKHT